MRNRQENCPETKEPDRLICAVVPTRDLTQQVEGKNRLLKVVLWCPHACHGTHEHKNELDTQGCMHCVHTFIVLEIKIQLIKQGKSTTTERHVQSCRLGLVLLFIILSVWMS